MEKIVGVEKEIRVCDSKAEGWKWAQDKGHLRGLEGVGRFVRDRGSWPAPSKELVSATSASLLVGWEVR